MFDEPNESPTEKSANASDRAREKSDEFRMHAELAAVFEGVRKFDAQIKPQLDADIARDIQRTIGKLEKAKTPESPILPPGAIEDAARVLDLPRGNDLLSTNDYHIHRRPGETMIVRWLAGDEVETYYTRLQAHFDAALAGHKEDERHAHEWKQDAPAQAYQAELEKIEVRMAERYLRPLIRAHNLHVLSTQAADELNVQYLADYVMSVPVEEIVGGASAPPSEPTERDLAWFFKLFSLRGMKDGVEQMCFFAYLQKTEESW